MRSILRVAAGCYIALIVTLTAASDRPVLDEAEVLRIASDFAHRQKWEVTMPGRHALFRKATREWQVLIQTRQNGGPMIVYVRDENKKVRFMRGE